MAEKQEPIPEQPVIHQEWETLAPVGWMVDVLRQATQKTLPKEQNLSTVILTQRLINLMHAIQLDAVTQMQEKTPDIAAAELSAALRITESRAKRMVGQARILHQLPKLTALLQAGELDIERVHAVHDVLRHAEPATVEMVEALITPNAAESTSTKLRQLARRALLQIDPEGAVVRHEKACAERNVQLVPREDDMAELRALLPVVQARRIFDTLTQDARAQRLPGDTRSLDQRRADVFVERMLGANPVGEVAQVKVIVSADTLLGLSQEPGFLNGGNPIHAELARILAAQGRWRIFRADEHGQLDAVSATRYRPSAALAEFLRTRYLTCTYPPCSVPSEAGDIDHVTPYPQGDTTEGNLQSPCEHHHILKHEHGYMVKKHPDGTIEWTTPYGRTYYRKPDDLPGMRKPSAGED